MCISTVFLEICSTLDKTEATEHIGAAICTDYLKEALRNGILWLFAVFLTASRNGGHDNNMKETNKKAAPHNKLSRGEINSELKKIAEDNVFRAAKPNISATASATECTGLIPAMPDSDEEFTRYQALSSTEIPKMPKE